MPRNQKKAGTPYQCVHCCERKAEAGFTHLQMRKLQKVCISCWDKRDKHKKKQCATCREDFTFRGFRSEQWKTTRSQRRVCRGCEVGNEKWTCYGCERTQERCKFSLSQLKHNRKSPLCKICVDARKAAEDANIAAASFSCSQCQQTKHRSYFSQTQLNQPPHI